MNTEREPNPAENQVEHDFSIPEDADFTSPGDPVDDERHLAEEGGDAGEAQHATPGNPLGDDK